MLIAIILILLILYLLSLRGRRNHPGLNQFRGWYYAHRGLHNASRPENSLAAFQAAVNAGYGMELDVHLLKDGQLAVIHDSLLQRTTGAEGRIEDLTADQLCEYHLAGTEQTIPDFRQVLALVDGKVPLIVELKSVSNNYKELCKTACNMLEGYTGPYCIESFDPRCVYWLRKHRPHIVRGQLVERFTKSKVKVPWILKFCLTYQLFNFLLLPDFVAHEYGCRKNLSNRLVRKLWGIQGVSWTLRTKEQFDTALSEDLLPIFEGFIP